MLGNCISSGFASFQVCFARSKHQSAVLDTCEPFGCIWSRRRLYWKLFNSPCASRFPVKLYFKCLGHRCSKVALKRLKQHITDTRILPAQEYLACQEDPLLAKKSNESRGPILDLLSRNRGAMTGGKFNCVGSWLALQFPQVDPPPSENTCLALPTVMVFFKNWLGSEHVVITVVAGSRSRFLGAAICAH